MTDVLVIAGVAVLGFACLGVVLMPGALARLHYVSVASVGVLLAVVAVLVHSGASLIGLKAVLVGAFLVATSPVLAHVTGRTIRERQERRR